MSYRGPQITLHGDGHPRALVMPGTIARAYKGRRYEDSFAAHADRGIVPRQVYREPRGAGSSLSWIVV